VNNKKEGAKTASFIVYACIAIWLIALWTKNSSSNPRTMNGRMEYESDDSIYVLKFQIDSVVEKEYDADGADPRF
jgi:hypothetical protein